MARKQAIKVTVTEWGLKILRACPSAPREIGTISLIEAAGGSKHAYIDYSLGIDALVSAGLIKRDKFRQYRLTKKGERVLQQSQNPQKKKAKSTGKEVGRKK